MLKGFIVLVALGLSPEPLPQSVPEVQLARGFDCSDRSCKSLSSCEEACYKLKVCGQGIRDRDNDGIPCENLCSRPCP